MQVDYTEYSIEELREARLSIDEEAYPERTAELDALLSGQQSVQPSNALSKEQWNSNKYSTFGPRLAASIVDGIFLSMLSAVLAFITAKIGSEAAKTIYGYIDYTQYAIYSVILHGLYGQTFGKKLFEVKVVKAKGEGNIGFTQAMLRDSVPILFLFVTLFASLYITQASNDVEIPSWVRSLLIVSSIALLVWHLLEIVTMLFNKKRRALHDFIAGTVVIRTD